MVKRKSSGGAVKKITNKSKEIANKATKTVSKAAKTVNKSVGNVTRSKRTTKKSKSKAKDNTAKLNKNRNASSKSKRQSKKNTKARKKAEYLATLPKSPLMRMAYRLSPKRFFQFWFSKRGAVMALKLLGISMAVFAVFIVSLFAYFRKDLPDPTSFRFDQSTQFYDKTGEVLLWSVYGDENRTLLEFGQISDYAKQAAIAIEDKDFYNHGGFSISGISRAAFSQTFGDGSGGGGSTITQQFVKNSLVGNEYSLTRKVKELILAVEIERLYTKDEIITFYLNEIPYGVSEYGIESASQGFFNKPASELTIDEAASLAALPNAPSLYSPYGENTDLLLARRDVIIDLMQEQGYITQEEADAAKEIDTLKKVVPLAKRSKYRNIKAPHFVLEVQKQLTAKYGEAIVSKGGLKVITTLDMKLQKIAEEAVANGAKNLGNVGADNLAFTASDPSNGQIVAMVGSRDFNYPEYGSYNVATALRQPGSSFKPYSYAEMMKSDRWGAGSVIFDTPTSFGNYKPKNYDSAFRGTMTIRSALAESRNIPAIKSLYIAGVENVIDQAKRQGITTLGDPSVYGLSLVLGSAEVRLAEHVNAYETFANGGKHYEQAYVLKVTNSSGEVLEEWTEKEGEDALDPQIAYSINSILSDERARARLFGNSPYTSVPGLTVAMKTGTTDQGRDGWMMGYTTRYSAGVWTGNNDNTPMRTFATQVTGTVLMEFLRRANEGQENQDFPRPEGIKTVSLDSKTGRLATSGGHSDIFPSWFKAVGKGDAKEVTIDKVSGKLATECTPERAKETKKESGVLPELPETDPMFSAWARSAPYGASGTSIDPEDKDDVHKCSDALPNVSVNTGGQNPNGTYTFSAAVTKGTHPLKTVNFKVDGQIVSSKAISASGTYTYDHKFSSTGNHLVVAEVIDSALYDNQSAPKTVNASTAVSLSITSPATGESVGTSVTVEWTKIPGAVYSLEEIDGGVSVSLYSGNKTTVDLTFVPGAHTIVLTSDKGGLSEITFTATN